MASEAIPTQEEQCINCGSRSWQPVREPQACGKCGHSTRKTGRFTNPHITKAELHARTVAVYSSGPQEYKLWLPDKTVLSGV